jgi:DNA-binding NarL/FixJ family response regulator
MPTAHILDLVDDSASISRAMTEYQPEVMVVDVNVLNGQDWELLRQLKARHALVRHIVLVDTFRQQAEARAAGADVVLVKGFGTAKLCEVIGKLVSG